MIIYLHTCHTMNNDWMPYNPTMGSEMTVGGGAVKKRKSPKKKKVAKRSPKKKAAAIRLVRTAADGRLYVISKGRRVYI